MTGKPKLYYFNGRGKMESVCWLLAAAGVEAFKTRISSIPTIKKFLEPGSQRKCVPDDKYMETVRRVLHMYHNVKAN